jgi:hypothetical protein
MVTLATPTVEVAWSGVNTGAFRIGVSTIGGSDVIGGFFGQNTFDDITAVVKEVQITRGRTNDLGAIEQGTCRLILKDTQGTYNPEAITYEDEVLADDPVIFIRLGEAGGATTAADSSGNGRDGTYVGGVVPGQTGALRGDDDSAAQFDGSTGYVSVPDATALHVADTFTVEYWIRFTSLAGSSTSDVISKGVGELLSRHVIVGGVANIQLVKRGSGALVTATATIADTNWHHVVQTKSGATVVQYLDGAVVTGTVTNQTMGTTTDALNLGRLATGNYLNGTLDEVAVYPTALSAARILAHYTAGTRYLAKRLRPLRPVRVRATHPSVNGGSAVGIFNGFTKRIEHNPHRSAQETVIECVDLFEWLNTVKPTIAATGSTTVGTVIGLLLDAAEWTDPSMRDLDTGSTIPDFSADGTQTAMALIQGLLQVDLGRFFIDGDGIATYHDRNTRFALAAAEDFAFTASEISEARPATDLERVRNRCTVTRTGGTAQTATDQTSRRLYGYRDDGELTTDYLSTDTEAMSLASFRVLLQKDPKPPTRAVKVWNKSDALIVHQLTREFGDRGTLTETAGGTSTSVVIEGLREQIRAKVWTVDYLLSKRTYSPFTIGVSAIGGTDVVGY